MGVGAINSAVGLNQALVKQEIQTTLLAKSNDAQKQQGEAVLSLLDSAIEIANASPSHSQKSGTIDTIA